MPAQHKCISIKNLIIPANKQTFCLLVGTPSWESKTLVDHGDYLATFSHAIATIDRDQEAATSNFQSIPQITAELGSPYQLYARIDTNPDQYCSDEN